MLFFGIFMTLLLLVHYYIYRRFSVWLSPLSSSADRAIFATLIFFALLFPLSRMLARASSGWYSTSLDWVASIWLGVLFYLFLGTVLTRVSGHAVELGFRIFGRQPVLPQINGKTIASFILIFTAAATAAGIYFARFSIGVTSMDVPVKNLPAGFSGFRIVQISDLHIGVLIRKPMIKMIVEKVNALDPDLVVITGDLVDEEASHLDGLSDELKKIRSKNGVLACTGNHEFYAGVEMAEKWASKAGIEFLRNTSRLIGGGLTVYGRDDPASSFSGLKPPTLDGMIGSTTKQTPVILLQHQPREFEKAASLGVDIMLSGHTHKGQIFPIEYISKLIYPRQYGRYTLGDSTMYVSSGAGTWGPPMRLGASPEIVLIKLIAK